MLCSVGVLYDAGDGQMKDVVIMMSSYNGEKYIKKQIDTIMEQKYDGTITLLIRDDGSNDATIKIIQECPQSQMRRIRLIKGRNVGPQRSFLALIRKAPVADFYFFADQDDIWYGDKIAKAVSGMGEYDTPICYCTNYDIVNTETGVRKERIIKDVPTFRPLKIIFYNRIPGCTMGFNRSLMAELKKLKLRNVMMHDSMVLSYCAAIGKIIFDKESSIAHRIHGNNVVGEGHKKIIPHKWIVDKLKLVIYKDKYDVSEMASEFMNNGHIKDEYVDDLRLLRDFKKSWVNTIKLLKHLDSHGTFMDRTTLSIRFKILLHVF